MVNQEKIVGDEGGEMAMKLPVGFRFRPTDEELLVHYLKRKSLCLPLPASVIPVCNVFVSDPWGLPGDVEEKRYFFCKRRWGVIVPTGSGSGYWKFIGKSKAIVSSQRNQVLGTRKSLSFYQGRYPNGCKTCWIMHEYSLLTQNQVGHVEDWVICLVVQRKKRTSKSHGVGGPTVIEFKKEDDSDFGPPQPYSPQE